MEEEKAAAYYDELTRKGGNAARFKQGLGFSSDAAADSRPERGAALASSSSSFLSSFVRASNSSSSKPDDKAEKQSQLQSIQNKLKKRDQGADAGRISKGREREKSRDRDRSRSRERERERDRRRSRSRSREREKDRRKRSRSRSVERERDRRRRSRSRSRERGKDRHRESRRDRRKRSRSRSLSDEDRRRGKERERARNRDMSSSPRYRRSERARGGDRRKRDEISVKKEKNGVVDYAKLIEGYDEMTAAEKVKAKMKLQLSETAGKDAKIGSGSGWERFEFEKDAPLDDNDDEEIKGGDDDAAVVKRLGQSFRFSNVEARRDEEIKNAHDEAMFGAPAAFPWSIQSESEQEDSPKEKIETTADDPAANLISEKVLAKQQGSWRDRARRNK